MRFVHTADWHIGSLRNNLPDDYLQRACDMIRTISRIVESHSDGVLVVAGDLFDRKHVTNDERDLLLTEVIRLEDAGVHVVMINGNHDLIQPKVSNLHWLDILCSSKKLKRTHLADCENKVVKIQGVPFALFPPRTRYDQKLTPTVMQAYLKGKKLKGSVVVTHLPIAGALGDNDRPIPGEDVTGLKIGRYVRYWALGDIHKMQEVRRGAWYCGAPVQHKRNEALPKGVLVIDTDDPTSPEFVEVESTPIASYPGMEVVPKVKVSTTVEAYQAERADLAENIPKQVAIHLKNAGLGKKEAKPLIRYVRKVMAEVKRH